MELIKSWYDAVVNYVALHPEVSVATYIGTVALLVFLF